LQFAPRRNPHYLLAGHAMLTGHGLCGRERGAFAGLVGSHCGRNIQREWRVISWDGADSIRDYPA
jgi:hypothetical protein